MPARPAPLVSIIIPAYIATARQAELLVETLATVRAQTCQDYEIILVDDGSPRHVASIINGGRAKTTLLRQPNAGSAVARNTGIRASRGSYVVFLDADDYLLPLALETGLRELAAHPECGFVVGGREEMTFEGAPVPWGVPTSPRETQLYNTLLGFHWHIIPPSSVMFRREVVETIGPWRDPWGADDLDYYLRAARLFCGRCFDEPAVTCYRRYSASSSRDGARMLRSTRAVYARQWPVVKGNPEGEAAYRRGLAALTEIFRDCLAENFRDHLRDGNARRILVCAALLRERARAVSSRKPDACCGGRN